MIDRIDHVVLNCRDVDAMADWYERVLGFVREEFHTPIKRYAMKFGHQKINLRPAGLDKDVWMTGEVDPPGALDICFIATDDIADVRTRLEAEGVEIIRGPGTQRGALGPMTSIYFRDPDGNLLEIATYDPAA